MTAWLLFYTVCIITLNSFSSTYFTALTHTHAHTCSQDNSPVGAIVLRNYTVSKACHDSRKQFAFKMVKGGARSYYFSADTEQEMNKLVTL